MTELRELCVPEGASLFEAMRAIEAGGEAIAFVCDGEGRVRGSLSDGDIRRALLGGAGLDSRTVGAVMHRDFVYVSPGTGRAEVLDLMRARDIGQVPVLDAAGRICGLHTIGRLLSSAERPNHAVILAGGRGSRLRPLTETVPKPMVKVAGRPILERLILHLMGHGVRHFHVAVGYMADVIEDYFGDGGRLGCRIEYLREHEPLGTGGPLSLLWPLPELPVVVVNGDLITQCDVGGMLEFHETGGYAATIGLKSYSVQIPFGVARMDGDLLVELREKPVERMLINAGVYVLSPEALGLLPRGQELPITDLFRRCLEAGYRIGGRLVEEEWTDIGHFDDLRRARGEL